MGKLFGTDGIRGVANEYPMTAEMAVKAGRAVASYFGSGRCRIVVGRDTRISGPMLESALVAGISSAGGKALLAGVVPTPAVARLAAVGAEAGVMISASHNPYYDNGIKVFRGDGFKLTDGQEAELEALILEGTGAEMSRQVRDTGYGTDFPDATDQYADFIRQSAPEGAFLKGVKLVLDCSNGATAPSAPRIFEALGADVHPIFILPDGKNINENCGSQHTETLSRKVLETGADAGLAFDGDGDRLVAVDEKGRTVTGDSILAVCTKHMKAAGTLKENLAVSTVMSNIGLGLALKKMDIRHVMTDVGDRYVLQEMLASGAVIGGEDSGHMIFLDAHTTGDGILTGVRLLEAVQYFSRPLSELSGIMKVYPQLLLNVEVKDKKDIRNVPEIVSVIHQVESRLGDEGRVLVRYSGTQPLCRVMVEGPDRETTRKSCEEIADTVRSVLGGEA